MLSRVRVGHFLAKYVGLQCHTRVLIPFLLREDTQCSHKKSKTLDFYAFEQTCDADVFPFKSRTADCWNSLERSGFVVLNILCLVHTFFFKS